MLILLISFLYVLTKALDCVAGLNIVMVSYADPEYVYIIE